MVALRRRAVLLLLLLSGAADAAAQQAPVHLEPDHWTWDAIRRLHVAGLAPPASEPAVAPVTRTHARHVFVHADSAARAQGRDALANLARAYLTQLQLESDSAGLLARAELRAGWMSTAGEALAGQGYYEGEDLTGAQALAGTSAPAAAVRAHGHPTPWLSWSIDGGRIADDWVVPVATIGVRAGPFDVWGGRRRLRYGIGHGGGTVVSTGHDIGELSHRIYDVFDGVGVYVREPFRFPWHLRHLGPIRIEVAGGRLASNGNVDDPYVVFGRLFGSPFTDRFTLGINRGAIFGGDGNAVTAERLLGLLIGLHGGEHGEFENQVFSTIVSVRPPLGTLGIELYAEVGMDDTAGAITDMPGIIAGIHVGAIPSLPAVTFAFEHTDFPVSCCGNPIWYRSVFFRGSWGDEGKLFAHPLGGHGREFLARTTLDVPQHGLLLRADAFVRDRGAENLYAPEREGRSRGGSASVAYRHANGFGVRADAAIERAAAWRMHRAALMLSYAFVRER